MSKDPLSRLNRLNKSDNDTKVEDHGSIFDDDIFPENPVFEEKPEDGYSKADEEISSVRKVELSADMLDDELQGDERIINLLIHEAMHEHVHEKSLQTLRVWFDEQLPRYSKLLEKDKIDNPDRIFDLMVARLQNLKLNDFSSASSDDDENLEEENSVVREAKEKISGVLMERIDAAAAAKLETQDLADQIKAVVSELLVELNLQLNGSEQEALIKSLLHDMLGFGPLEPLLEDDAVTDIMVNGAQQIYVERNGKLELSKIKFRDDAHVMNIATRIVTKIGRRIDETSPLCDARLPDGSRVNIIIPPLALDGPSISIRKFPKHRITLDVMARQGNISDDMATVLKIAARSRLNILISGGTGSGKTTSLNAMSQMIDAGERIVTIEDAAELQLQQPHVVRLETRPPNLEGDGEITMRDLVKNSLRMRPDRVILGEIRGAEAVDMLQAMNTGHDGSLCTIHANNPREALTRLENMVGMAGINLPAKAVRTQISSAVDMIIQVSRMRDGMRRITYVTEVLGMEGDVVTTQDLFKFEFEGEGDDGKLFGRFKSSGLRPYFVDKANYFGLERALLAAMENQE